ncbi:hypothetical protein NXS19_001003 [Fusarium pseudograminearum]|nr:hypothetical protein NXS19_001003 [Fusarium pseudograminearum]
MTECQFSLFHIQHSWRREFVHIYIGFSTGRFNIDGIKTGFAFSFFLCVFLSSWDRLLSALHSRPTASPSKTNSEFQHHSRQGRSESECRSDWDGAVSDRLRDKGWGIG